MKKEIIGINDYGQLSKLKICGRCRKPIKNTIWFIENGYGPVHVVCYNLNIQKNEVKKSELK